MICFVGSRVLEKFSFEPIVLELSQSLTKLKHINQLLRIQMSLYILFIYLCCCFLLTTQEVLPFHQIPQPDSPSHTKCSEFIAACSCLFYRPNLTNVVGPRGNMVSCLSCLLVTSQSVVSIIFSLNRRSTYSNLT